MSALTDLFTALANKIRSKTGTATTYTPLEMVSDGIDDVYDAGYAAGGGGATGTPITPSNSSPASMTSGTTYEAQANGYAIASYSSVTPSNSSPVALSSGSIYKMGGAGKAVASVTDITPSDSTPAALSSGTVYKAGGAGYAYATQQTSTSITPSNTSPAYMSANTKYTPTAVGYAISSYSSTSVTPTTSGTAFSSGWNRMTSFGYAYSSQPSSGYTNGWNSETTLWTNSSATSSFGAQNVTLSQSIQNFNYIKIICRASTSVSTTSEAIFSKSFVLSCVSGNAAPRMALSTRTGSQSYVRIINYASDTQIYFDTAHKRATSGDTNGYVIPTSIVGLK